MTLHLGVEALLLRGAQKSSGPCTVPMPYVVLAFLEQEICHSSIHLQNLEQGVTHNRGLVNMLDRCVEGWMDGCMDGWIDGWMDG